jgi:hypothetical protein
MRYRIDKTLATGFAQFGIWTKGREFSYGILEAIWHVDWYGPMIIKEAHYVFMQRRNAVEVSR